MLSHTNSSKTSSAVKIDDLVSVWGLDIPLENADGCRRMRNVLEEAAAEFGMEPVAVATNLHATNWWHWADWGAVGHGAALASLGLALERRYQKLLIPSTHRYDLLAPWGSHPLTDPLLSTRWMEIIHDGTEFSR